MGSEGTVRVLQPSFGAGELSPSLSGRVDLAKYRVGLKTCKNFFIHRHGGASNRPGFTYKGGARGEGRLIPFQFSVEQNYMLEFTNLRIRVLKDGEFVQLPLVGTAWKWTASGAVAGAFYLEKAAGGDPAIVTPERVFLLGSEADNGTIATLGEGEWAWGNVDALAFNTLYVHLAGGTDPDTLTAADVTTDVLIVTTYTTAMLPTLKYEQSADVLFLVHPSAPPADLTRTSHIAWTFTTHGTAAPSITSGMTTITATYTAPRWGSLNITSVSAASPARVNIPGHGLADGTRIVIAGTTGTMSTLLNNKMFLAKFVDANNFDLLDITGNNFPTTTFVHTAGTGTVSSPTATMYYKIVGVTADGQETDGIILTSAVVDLPWAQSALVKLDWNAAVGGGVVGYNIYKTTANGGNYGFIGYTTETEFNDDNILPGAEGPQISQTPFSGSGKYPGAVGIFQQRLWFARTDEQPQTVFGSQTALFSNFSTSDPLRDSDAVEATLASRQVDEIKHLVPLRQLVAFTSGAEWIVQSGSGQGGPITPTSVSFDTQGYRGCTDVRPIVIGNSAIFVQRGGAIIRDLFYNLQDDSLTGNDLSILASHLFKDHYIKDWAFQQTPDSIVWTIRDDGKLLGLTYIREQDVWAWHQHDTEGEFESIASLPGKSGKPDEVYVITRRYINSTWVRFIEILSERLPESNVRKGCFLDASLSYDAPVTITAMSKASPCVVTTSTAHGLSNGDRVFISDIDQYKDTEGFEQLNKTWFVVSGVAGLSFSLLDLDGVTPIDTTAYEPWFSGGEARKGVSLISGLEHLAGHEVSILADGNVMPIDTVSALGTITLPRKFATVHVGLPYTCDLQSLSLEASDGQSLFGQKQRVIYVVVRFENTRGVFFGPDADHLDEMKTRNYEGYLEETQMFTGEKDLQFDGKWERSGQVFLRQEDPLPVTVLLWAPEVEVEE